MTGDLMAVSRRGDERPTLLAASHRRLPPRRAVSPRFEDAELERRFRRSFDAAALPLVRMGTALGVLLTIMCIVVVKIYVWVSPQSGPPVDIIYAPGERLRIVLRA